MSPSAKLGGRSAATRRVGPMWTHEPRYRRHQEAGRTQETLRNFVNGKYTDPRDGQYSDVVDPSTGEPYAKAPVSSAADVDAGVQAAAAAFESWGGGHPPPRRPA